MPKGYWIKPATRTTFPRRIVTIVVASRPAGPTSPAGRTPLVWSHAAGTTAEYRGCEWGRARHIETESPVELLDWVESQAAERTRTWVVTPDLPTTLFLSGFWSRAVERGCKWSGREGAGAEAPTTPAAGRQSASGEPHPRSPAAGLPSSASDNITVSQMVLGDKVGVLKYHSGGRSFVWLSGKQLFPLTEEGMADSLRFRWGGGQPVPVPHSYQLRPVAERARLWMLAMQHLADWWREIGGGPFSPTHGGLGWSFVRRRLSVKSVLAHQEPAVRELEEAGLFGGRAVSYFYGPVQTDRPGFEEQSPSRGRHGLPRAVGPLHLWDVRSMYPSILAHNHFPVRLLHQWCRPSVRELSEMLEQWCVIASVRLKTESPEYPYRHKERVVCPVGEFDTVLCGPELSRAVADGAVLQVYRAATYQRGKPFAVAMGELLEERRKSRSEAGPLRELLVKLVSNSFGGRMAMKRSEWVRRPDVWPEDDRQWGQWSASGSDGRQIYRVLAGLVQQKRAAENHGRPLAACFAHLTSYGRYVMRLVREALPPHTVVSQDTDGLWVLRPTAEMFASACEVAASEGCELIDKPHKRTFEAIFYGPRHYWTDHGWTLSGVSDTRRYVGGLSWDDHFTVVPMSGGGKDIPVWVYDCERHVRLGDIPPDGTVGGDGWVVPHRFTPPLDPDRPRPD